MILIALGERQPHDVLEGRREVRLQIFFQVLGQLVEVAPVLVRQAHVRDARAPRGDDLLLDAADREHLTRQG